MTPKEEALAILKDIVTLLKEKGKEMKARPELASKAIQQNSRLAEAMKNLSSEERQWVDTEYRKWAKDALK